MQFTRNITTFKAVKSTQNTTQDKNYFKSILVEQNIAE